VSDFKSLFSARKLILLTFFVMLGLSVYLYLPIRSSLAPAINWGRPDTLPGLISYLLRTSQPTAPVSESAMPYLNRFWFNLTFPVDQFRLPFFWLGVVGAVSLFKSCRRVFLFTISIFILNVLTATWATDFSKRNYDLLGYLLPSLCVFTVWFAVGVRAVLSWAVNEVRGLQARPVGGAYKIAGYGAGYALFGLFLVLPVLQAHKNFDRCNKNVKPVSVSALRLRSYREQISGQYEGIRLPGTDLTDFGEIAFEVSRLNAKNFPVYSAHYFNHPEFARHLRPAGYIFEFSPKRTILTDKDMEEQKSFLKESLEDRELDLVTREHFGNLLFNLGAFYDRLVGSPSSVECFLWALDVDPTNPRIYFQLGKAFLRDGDKAKAQDFFRAGLELDPFNREAKRLLEQT
jgi:hypothetical protein